MKYFLLVFTIILTLFSNILPQDLQIQKTQSKSNISHISVENMNGEIVPLDSYTGKVLLIVNVASKCGYTPQYEGLQKLFETYKERGFEILAFPCNDFGGQEPGTNEDIKEFCETNFNVTFSLFDKIKVLGPVKSPLYKLLTDNPVTGKSEIGWNFEKFIIDKNGNIIARFKSSVEPESEEIIDVIEDLL